MTTSAVRDKLYDYIRVADDKKIKAIYLMLEDDIIEKAAWWKDAVFLSEIDNRYAAWTEGREKGYSIDEISDAIGLLKKKRTK